jgi:hypothetical protein
MRKQEQVKEWLRRAESNLERTKTGRIYNKLICIREIYKNEREKT